MADIDNKVSIVVGAQDNSKLDLESLKRKLTDMGKMIETARVSVKGDKEGEVAVERLALKLAALGKKAASPRIGLEGAARAEVDIAAVGLSLERLGDKAQEAARKEAEAAAATAAVGLSLERLGDKAQEAARKEAEAAAATAAVGASAEVAKEKVGDSGGGGLAGKLAGLGKVLGGVGGVAAGALGIGLAGPLGAAGLAMGAFAAVAMPTLRGVFTAMTAVTAANAKFAAAATIVRQSVTGSRAVTEEYRKSLAGLSSGQRDAVVQLGNSSVTWQALSKSQQANLVSLSQNKGEMKNLLPAQKQSLAALLASKAAWDQLTPAQQRAASSIQGVKDAFTKVATAAAPAVLQVTTMAAGIATSLMPALSAFAGTGAKVLDAVLRPMGALFKSSFFGSFVTQMSQLASQVAPLLGQQLAALLVVFMQMFMQAGPAAVQILGQLVPAIVQIVGGLVPFVVAVTEITASTVTWLAKNRLLIPALGLLGAAIVAVGLAMDTTPVGAVIAGFALMIGAVTHLWQTSLTFRQVVTGVFSVVGRAVLTFAELWLDELHIVTSIWLTAVGIIVHGAAAALGWVPGVGPALKTAVRGFDAFKDGVNHVFDAAHTKIEQWKTNLANLPKVVKIEGNITDLTAKLHTAITSLANPHLTATRRSAIVTNIGQLQVAIANARAALDAINGKVATTYVQTIQLQPHGTVPGGRVEHGGIIGAASGGIHSNLRLVGEHGAELVSLPPGSMVHSNPDTQRMLSGGGAVRVLVSVDAASFTEAGLSPAQVRNIKATIRHLGGTGPGAVQAAFGN